MPLLHADSSTLPVAPKIRIERILTFPEVAPHLLRPADDVCVHRGDVISPVNRRDGGIQSRCPGRGGSISEATSAQNVLVVVCRRERCDAARTRHG